MSNPNPETRADFYADASIYDILYTPGSAQEVDLLQRIARRHISGRGALHWLEPACGSGRLVRVLAQRGHRVTGFDRSEPMLDYARDRVRKAGLSKRARLVQADLDDFDHAVGTRRFDVAFVTVNTIRHLLTGASMARHFASIARALEPGGVYIVGISLADYESDEASEDVWHAQRGSCRVKQIVQYLPGDRKQRQETVLSHLEVRRPTRVEHLDSRYELRSYDEAQWKSLLKRVGFERREILDDRGVPVGDRQLNYQLEVLVPRP